MWYFTFIQQLHSIPASPETQDIIKYKFRDWRNILCMVTFSTSFRLLIEVIGHNSMWGSWLETNELLHWGFSTLSLTLSQSPSDCLYVLVPLGSLSPLYTTVLCLWQRWLDFIHAAQGQQVSLWRTFLWGRDTLSLVQGKTVCVSFSGIIKQLWSDHVTCCSRFPSHVLNISNKLIMNIYSI